METTEEGPDGMLIPTSVRVKIEEEQSYHKRRGLLDDDEQEAAEEEKPTTEIKLATRICPRCHLTLPKGFATEQVRTIGLVGGTRCGKTTYMTIACKYMKYMLGKMNNGMDLGKVDFIYESEKYLNDLYESQTGATGAISTPEEDTVMDRPVFPIVAHVTPADTSYRPFYVIFRDIPGEYMKPENKDKLINSPIPDSTDLISLIDINSLMDTRMMEDHRFGDFCPLQADELFENFDELGDAMKPADGSGMKLQTVQICVTKLDFWIDADRDAGRTALFARATESKHRNSISDRTLDMISGQIREKLRSNVAGSDHSELMEAMLQDMGMREADLRTAYTAIASRVIPGNEAVFENGGIDYKHSLNVLHPVLNIFRWADLLPHDDDDRIEEETEQPDDGHVDPEPDLPTHQSIIEKIKNLFGKH